MAIITRIFLWFSTIITLNLVYAVAQSDNYIIHMDASAMPKAFSSQHAWYLSTLSSALANARTSNYNHLNIPHASSKLIYTYTNAMNGFSANLSPEEFEALKISPGYISSVPDLPGKLHTTHSPEFLGLNPNTGAWPAGKFGEDVIVGLVDTGIWPESESFNDEGMPDKLPSRWHGNCESSIKCNNKLIGARFFNKGFHAMTSNLSLLNSTRDTEGHGTHTSSIAVGSQVHNASFFGYANGSAKGVAPRARLAMYKVSWFGKIFTSDVIAAVDAAISDGVDILSLSLGFGDAPLLSDPVAIQHFQPRKEVFLCPHLQGMRGLVVKPYTLEYHGSQVWLLALWIVNCTGLLLLRMVSTYLACHCIKETSQQTKFLLFLWAHVTI